MKKVIEYLKQKLTWQFVLPVAVLILVSAIFIVLVTEYWKTIAAVSAVIYLLYYYSKKDSTLQSIPVQSQIDAIAYVINNAISLFNGKVEILNNLQLANGQLVFTPQLINVGSTQVIRFCIFRTVYTPINNNQCQNEINMIRQFISNELLNNRVPNISNPGYKGYPVIWLDGIFTQGNTIAMDFIFVDNDIKVTYCSHKKNYIGNYSDKKDDDV